MEQIGMIVVILGVLALWMLRKGASGGVSTRLSQEQREALEGAVVLLADDSVTIQKVIELTFMDTSARLICAADGKSAIDLLKKQDFDLIITDVHMPARNGYEVCEHAKRLDPEIPVLLLVGAFESFSRDRYKRCGADEFLKKPFNSAELVGIASRLLQRRSAGQSYRRRPMGSRPRAGP